MINFGKRLCYLLIAFAIVFNTIPVSAKVFFLEADFYQEKKNKEQRIIVGRGEILSSGESLERIAVTDPSIADLQLLNDKQVFVRGRRLGRTTILVWEKANPSPARFELSVIPDMEELTRQLQKLDPNIMVEYIPPSSSVGQVSINENVGDFAPEVPTMLGEEGEDEDEEGDIVNELDDEGGAFPPLDVNASAGAMLTAGRVILTGEVMNADVIAKSLHLAGSFVGDEGIRIVGQAGGQIISGANGDTNLVTNGTGGGGGAFGGAIQSAGISFTSNRNANLSRGTIVTTTNGAVISFLQVKNPAQIAVTIRFYEITRSLTRSLGLNGAIPGGDYNFIHTIGGPDISGIMLDGSTINQDGTGDSLINHITNLTHTVSDGATTAIFDTNNGIGLVLQALQERGEVKTLSEPTLVISNGEPATFLAGGEVPVQSAAVVAGGATQNITFEPFGINVSILPTITSKDTIHLQLVPETREIDTELSNFVSPAGGGTIRPPAFRTRRTETQVELMPGQALAISGLLSDSNTRSLNKMPGIADIPVLGTLFRSKSFRRGESELLIVVVPKIIEPTSPEEVPGLVLDDDPPSDEFNVFAPLKKPYVMIDDERGPDNNVPIDPDRYYEPGEKGEPVNPSHPGTYDGYLTEKHELNEIKKELEAKKLEITESDVKLRTKNNQIIGADDSLSKKKDELVQLETLLRNKGVELTQLSNKLKETEEKAKTQPLQIKKEEISRVLNLLDNKKQEIVDVSVLLRKKSEEIEVAEKVLKEKDKELADYDKEIEKKKEELQKVHKPLEERSKEIQLKEQELQAKVKEIEEVENLLKEKSEQAEKIESLLSKTLNRVKQTEKPLKEKEEELAKKAKEIGQLEALLASKNNEIAKVEKSLENGVKTKKLESVIKKKTKEISKIEKLLEEKNAKILQAEKELKEKAEKIKKAELPLRKKNKRLAKVEEELKAKSEEAKKIEESLVERKEELDKAEKTLKVKMLRASQKNQKIKESNSLLKSRQTEIAKLESLINEKKAEFEKYDSEAKARADKVRKFEAPLKEKSAKITKLEEELKLKELEIAKHEETLSKKIKAVAKVEQELEVKKERAKKAEIPIKEKNEKLEKLSSVIKAKNEKIEKVEAALENRSKKVEEMEKMIAVKAKELAAAEERLKRRNELSKELLKKERMKIESEARIQSELARKEQRLKLKEEMRAAKKKEKELARLKKQEQKEAKKKAREIAKREKEKLKEAKRKEKLLAKKAKEKLEKERKAKEELARKEKEKLDEKLKLAKIKEKEAAEREKTLLNAKLEEAKIKEQMAIKKQQERISNVLNDKVKLNKADKKTKVSKKEIMTMQDVVNTSAKTIDNKILFKDVAQSIVEPKKNKAVLPGKPKKQISKTHIVEPGQSLWNIARMYFNNPSQVEINMIMKSNNIEDPNKVLVGQKLMIPTK